MVTGKRCATTQGDACSGGENCRVTTIETSATVKLNPASDQQPKGIWVRMEARRVVSVEGAKIELDEPFHHPIGRLYVLNNRSTLLSWLRRNCFIGAEPQCEGSIGPDATAKYQNEFDLNFGRWMFMKTLPNDSVSFIVFNYKNISRFPSTSPLESESWPGLLAAVTMERRAPTTTPRPRSRPSLPTTPPVHASLTPSSMDRRMCTSYRTSALPATAADRVTWIVRGICKRPTSSRSIQSPYGYAQLVDERSPESELAMRSMNEAICRYTNPSEGTKEFVAGMVGQPADDCGQGRSLTGDFRPGFVAAGWKGSAQEDDPPQERLYTEVFAPSCRLCHVTRDAPLSFQHYEVFKAYHGVYNPACNSPYLMPQAERTYYNFWLGAPEAPRLLVEAGLATEDSTCGVHATTYDY